MANGEYTSNLPPSLGSRKLLSSRRGTIALAALAALAALGVLLLFMSNYRDSVRSGVADTRILVADQFIDKGTSGDAISDAQLFNPVTITEDESLEGAITDPSQITGQVLAEPVYEGQQLTASSFTTGADPVAGKLSGTQRALSVPVDIARGNIEQLEAGSRVDVLGSATATILNGRAAAVVDSLARDVLVLRVPESTDDDTEAVVLRVSDKEASRVAFAADTGKIWLTVRPPTLGKNSKASDVREAGTSGEGIVSLLGE